jgi:hypothetical protein
MKDCPPDKERSKHTNRCIKKCKANQTRNDNGRCVNKKSTSPKSKKSQKRVKRSPCPKGQVRDRSTKRCRESKMKKVRHQNPLVSMEEEYLPEDYIPLLQLYPKQVKQNLQIVQNAPIAPKLPKLFQLQNEQTLHQPIGMFVHFGLYSIVHYRFITPIQRNKFRKFGGGNGAEWLQDILTFKDGDWRPPAGWKETQAYFHENFKGMKYEDLNGELEKINFSTEHIIRVAKKMNASYIVFTTKHHDGYCMYPSMVTPNWSSKRDYVGEVAKACRENGLLFGAYYSWPAFNHKCKVDYMENVVVHHIHEIQTRYRPDIWWFDGHWEVKTIGAQKVVNELVSYLKKINKDVQINDRLGMEYKIRKTDIDWLGNATFRNFEDRFMPDRRPMVPWEYIDTVGFSWGRNTAQVEGDYKSGKKLKELYDKVDSLGGKFMINVGPNPDGTIDEFEEKSLEEFGKLF